MPPRFVAILLLVLAPAALYGTFLDNPAVFDDAAILDDLNKLHEKLSSSFSLRWFSYYSITWAWTALGADIVWLRVGNLILHIAASLALFGFLRGLISAQPNLLPARVPAFCLCWLAALLFAIHPVGVYGVAYLVQRSIVMATLFSILFLWSHLRALERAQPVWFLLAAACYFVAAFSKEHSVGVPLVALALTLLLRRPSIQLAKATAIPFALYAIIGGLVVWSSRGLLGQAYEPISARLLAEAFSGALPENAWGLSVLTQSYLYFKYALLWLFPNPAWMSIDVRATFASSLFSWPYSAAFLVFLALGGVAVRLLLSRGPRGFIGFILLLSWLPFAPEFSAVRIQEPFVLYRSYLWGAGFTTLAAFLVLGLPRKMAIGAIVVGTALLMGASTDRLKTFASNFALWDDAERLLRLTANPSLSERIYFNRGNAHFENREYQRAIADYSQAISLRPGISAIHNNRGFSYLELRRPQQARTDFEAAITFNPAHGRAHIGLGIALESLGHRQPAGEAFRRACLLGYPATCRKSFALLTDSVQKY